MGLFFSPHAMVFWCFKNLPIFSPVEPFWTKNKFFNFFEKKKKKIRTFAPLIEKPNNSEND